MGLIACLRGIIQDSILRLHIYGLEYQMLKLNTAFASFATFAFALVACSQPTPTATVAPLSTATPTSSAPLVILLTPPESDPNLLAVAAEVTASYAATNNLQFEQRSLLNPAELPASLVKLVVLAPDPGALALATAAPQVTVITLGFEVEGGLANTTSISTGSGGDSSQIAFIAGYIAAMSAEDWRAGILYSAGSALIVNDYSAGANYFCGSCAPVAPPYIVYPVSAQATDAQNWQAAADQLISQLVKVVYLTPEMEASGAAQYLANFGVLLIGNAPSPPELTGSWIVSVSSVSSDSLRESLLRALNGEAIADATTLSMINPNSSLFSESRQTNVAQVAEDLQAGFIQLPPD
jgi:hypothetical protein